MNIIINSIQKSSGNSEMKPSWYYVLRDAPGFDVNNVIGVQVGSGYTFEINVEKSYKMFDGPNLSSLSENTNFGIKTGSLLALSSKYIPAAALEEKNEILTKEIENINSNYPVPHEYLITGDTQLLSKDLDMQNLPYNFNYQ